MWRVHVVHQTRHVLQKRSCPNNKLFSSKSYSYSAVGKNSPKAIRQTVWNQTALSIRKTGTKRRVELEDDESDVRDVHVIHTRNKGLPAKLYVYPRTRLLYHEDNIENN